MSQPPRLVVTRDPGIVDLAFHNFLARVDTVASTHNGVERFIDQSPSRTPKVKESVGKHTYHKKPTFKLGAQIIIKFKLV